MSKNKDNASVPITPASTGLPAPLSQQARIAELMNSMPGGIAIVEVDPQDIAGSMRTIYYNDRFFHYSGYSREEYDALLQRDQLHFVFQEDIPALLSATERMCAEEAGAAADCTIRCRTREGGYRWLLLTGQLAQRRGSVCVLHILLVDVTDRKAAEDRERISEEMLRVAAETDRRAVILYDVKANSCHVESRTLFSSAYDEVFTDIPDSLLQRGIAAAASVDDLCALFSRIRQGEEKLCVSLQLHTGRDEYQWFECNATVIFDADKKPDHAILVLHNITEQRIKEAVFKKWQQSIGMRPASSYTLFRCNLSQDASLDEQSGTLLQIQFSSEAMSFNARTKMYAEQYVYSEDRSQYMALLNSDALLAKFYRGEHMETLEFREQSPGGELLWRHLTVEMVEYLNSSDVQAFLMYEDINEKKKAELRERELAETDPLTGALNRATFAHRVEALFSEENAGQHALLMLDMDGFKQLNDTFGHAAGDQALIDTTAVLRSVLRQDDLICRLGGDEFLLLLRDIPYDAVIEKKAQQICSLLRKAFSLEVQLSASLGIAVFPRDGHDFDALYRKADKALYQVKNAGKDNYTFFSKAGGSPAPEGAMAADAASDVRPAAKARRRMLIVEDGEASRNQLRGWFEPDYLIETASNTNDAMIRLRHFSSAISLVLLDLDLPRSSGFDILSRMQSDAKLRTIPVIALSACSDNELSLKAIEGGACDYVAKPIDPKLIRLRAQSAVSKAENERLRAQNSYLQLQRDEEVKLHTVLESTGTVIVEYDWRNHVFLYDNTISRHIAGQYNNRGLWQVLLSDAVADVSDIQAIQNAVLALANDRQRNKLSRLVRLKTPEQQMHWFRMNIYKQTNELQLAEKMIITFNDVHEEVLANEKLRYQATRDELTGLYNRSGFLERAGELIAARQPGYYVMACIDIEGFKVINDQYGTEKGDMVLRQVAEVLTRLHNFSDSPCCRVMADNFAVLYPKNLLGTQALAESHRQVETLDRSLPPLRFCVGRCLADDPALSASAFYDRAAMAKDTVKGRYDTHIALFDESMRTDILRQQRIAGEMKTALEVGQFEVWFQPQYNHANRTLCGAEALVRWRHPVDGLISPAQFIPVFERNGFVYELDKFVWEQACLLLRGWLDRGLSPVPVSVNVSRYDMLRSDMVQQIANLVEKYALPVDLLRLEITESAFAESSGQIIRVVKDLIARGFIVEIDDFGSGYSSLNTLKDVPAQILKMDMRFLESDQNSQRGGSIIESVVRMAKWLGMSIIAEGVETAAQADYLRSIGCKNIQGYLYARPMPADKYEAAFTAAKTEPALEHMEAVDTWDNGAFWDPQSIESLVFNSYVGGASVFEYHNGVTEIIRRNKEYDDIFSGSFAYDYMSSGPDTLEHLSAAGKKVLLDNTENAIRTGAASCEVCLSARDGKRKYLRVTARPIARAGERYLLYCVLVDVTAEREASGQLQFLNDFAHDLLAQSDSEEAIQHALQKLLDYFAGDRSYVMEMDYEKKVTCNTYEACASGITSEIENLQNIPFETSQYWFDLMRQKQFVVIDDVETLGEDRAALRALLLAQNIRSLFVAPLWREGELVGFLGVDNPAKALHQLTRLGALGDYIAVLLTRRDLNATLQGERQMTLALMDDIPGGFVRMKLSDGGAFVPVFSNAGFQKLVGMNREQLHTIYGSDVLAGVHPDDRDIVREAGRRMLSEGSALSERFRMKNGSGDYLWSMFSGRATKDYRGETYLNVYYADVTAQELSFRESLPFIFSTIMESSTDLAFAKDNNFRYLCCSQTFAALLGLKSEKEVVGKTDYELFSREIADQFRQTDAALMAAGQPMIDSVESIPSPDGVLHYTKTSKHLLRNTAGEIIGLYGAGRDITENKEAFNQLKLMTDSIPGGLATFACAKDGIRIIYSNSGFCDLFGVTAEEYARVTANDPLAYVFQEDREAIIAQYHTLMQAGTPIDCVYRIHMSSGGLRWVHHRAVISDRHNETAFVNAVLLDITDQQQEREQLRLAEEEYRLAIAHSRTTTCRYNIASRTLTITAQAAQRLELPEVIEDVPYSRVKLGRISADTAQAYIRFYEGIMNGERESSVTFRKLLPAGWRWISAHETTMFSGSGKPISAIISFLDVTEQQEKETIYRKWQQKLRERGAGAYTLFRCNLNKNTSFDTAEGALFTFITNDDGAQSFNDRTRSFARQCVYAEDREKYIAFVDADKLLAGYHRGQRSAQLDFRGKLTSGAIHWVRLSVELVEYPNSTDVAAYLMYEDINDSMLEELQTRREAETDPLTGLLNRKAFTQQLGALLRARKDGALLALFMLDMDGFKLINDSLGHAAGDRALIDAGRAIRSLVRDSDLVCRLGGDEFLVCLNDMPDRKAILDKAKQLCRLTHKAFHLDVRTSVSLGIAVCPDDGSTFDELYQKADQALYYVKEHGKDNCAFYSASMRQSPHEHSEKKIPALPDGPGARRKMLIAEDSAVNRAVLENIFQNDFDILTAENGQDALTCLRRGAAEVSIVLLDLMMPGMDGFAVLDKMQDSAQLQSIPVIVVSGMDDRETNLRAIRCGAADYVTKPVDAELLRLRVASAISKAENERLRLHNHALKAQRFEFERLRSVLEDDGTAITTYNTGDGSFRYEGSMARYIAGGFDDRPLWDILTADNVLSAAQAGTLRGLLDTLRGGDKKSAKATFSLKTPEGELHPFRVKAIWDVNTLSAGEKLLLVFTDLQLFRA